LQEKREDVIAAAKSVLSVSLKESMKLAELEDPGHVEPCVDRSNHCPKSEMMSTGTLFVSDILSFLGVFFPGRPVVRTLKRVELRSAKEEQCSKDYQANSRLGNGLVLFWCGKHRVCLGWVLLQSAESLEIVYTTLLTRFPVLPKIVCYDNACNLAEYCYNRAPR
jgi:hypothetical protein